MDKWSKNAAESPKLIEFSIYISIKLNQNFSKFDDSTFTVYDTTSVTYDFEKPTPLSPARTVMYTTVLALRSAHNTGIWTDWELNGASIWYKCF